MDWIIPVVVVLVIVIALPFVIQAVQRGRGRTMRPGRPVAPIVPGETFVDTSQSTNQPPRHHHHHQAPQHHHAPPTHHTPPVHHVPPPTHH
jgi:hypothetical protein